MKSLVPRTCWFPLFVVDSLTLPSGAETAKKLEKNPVYSRVENEIPRSDFPEHYPIKQHEKTRMRPNRMHMIHTWPVHLQAALWDLPEQKRPDLRTVQSPSHPHYGLFSSLFTDEAFRLIRVTTSKGMGSILTALEEFPQRWQGPYKAQWMVPTAH